MCPPTKASSSAGADFALLIGKRRFALFAAKLCLATRMFSELGVLCAQHHAPGIRNMHRILSAMSTRLFLLHIDEIHKLIHWFRLSRARRLLGRLLYLYLALFLFSCNLDKLISFEFR